MGSGHTETASRREGDKNMRQFILLLILILLFGWLLFWFTHDCCVDRTDEPYVPLSDSYIYPIAPIAPVRAEVLATITCYHPTRVETDDDPWIVASGKRAKEGFIACPQWLKFGTYVVIRGESYVCEDRMAPRYRQGNYFDIFETNLDKNYKYKAKVKILY